MIHDIVLGAVVARKPESSDNLNNNLMVKSVPCSGVIVTDEYIKTSHPKTRCRDNHWIKWSGRHSSITPSR